jgi:hypothetical protein
MNVSCWDVSWIELAQCRSQYQISYIDAAGSVVSDVQLNTQFIVL